MVSWSLAGPLFPDELIWSGCARFKRRFSAFSDEDISTEFLERRHTTVCKTLPRFGRLLSQSFGYGSDVERLLQDHTYWPWLSPFIDRQTRRSYLTWFEACEDGRTATMQRRKRSRIYFRKEVISPLLKACPECMERDEREYGETYWHRSHQFRCLAICPKHQSPLVRTTVRSYNPIPHFRPLQWKLIEEGSPCHIGDEVFQKALARGLSTFPSDIPGKGSSQGVYRNLTAILLGSGAWNGDYETGNQITMRVLERFGSDALNHETIDWSGFMELSDRSKTTAPSPLIVVVSSILGGFQPSLLWSDTG